MLEGTFVFVYVLNLNLFFLNLYIGRLYKNYYVLLLGNVPSHQSC